MENLNYDSWMANNEIRLRKEEFNESCEKKAAEKLVIQWYHDKMIDDPINNILNKFILKEDQEEFVGYCQKRTGGRYKFIMFTINFKEDCVLVDIEKKLRKCVKKKWIDNWMYCFETRNEDGQGLHVHMKCWIKEGKKPYDCKREVYNTFKDLVGNRMHVNARYSNIDGCFEKYIMGIKGDEKKLNYENDLKWRKINNVEDVYSE